MEISNQQRQVHLFNQRTLQIIRTGINVTFHKGSNLNFSCLQFDAQYGHIIKQWIEDRICLNKIIVDRSNVYMADNLLYLQDRNVDRILRDGCLYILARNNATIEILTQALTGTNQVHSQIYQFINNPQAQQLSSNRMFDLDDWAYHGLNQSQKQAVELVINQRIAFIKGPPGCGKTKTIARLATIFSYHGYPMLIGAVTNTANMTILYTILKQAYQMNFMPNIVLFINKQLYVDYMMHPPEIRCLTFRYKIVQNIIILNEHQQMHQNAVQILLDGYWSGHPTSKKFISIYYQAMAKTFAQANIVIITTTSAVKINYKLQDDQKYKPFIGILDQASQASWADALCFLNRGVQKMVFIGDDKQLTPTVISQNQVLKQTMFTTLFMKNIKYFVLLNQQYRMHPAIAQFPNQYFYQNQLKNGTTAEQRTSQISYFNKYPISFMNCQYPQQQQIETKSGKRNYWNKGQIQIIKKILCFFPVQQFTNIGIISPYDLQIKMISQSLGMSAFQYGLTTRTCDGYQGSQKQYIILSCVRSNKQGKIGFCNQQNRLNVSITRAMRGLILIGNVQTFLSDAQQPNVWHKYLQYVKQNNIIRQVSQLSEFPIYNHNFININEEILKSTQQNGTQINNLIEELQEKNNIIQTDPLQIQFISQQQQEQGLNKVYKQLKKILKSTINKIRIKKQQKQKFNKYRQQNEEKIKDLDKQIIQLKKQLQQTIKKYANQSCNGKSKKDSIKNMQNEGKQTNKKRILKASHNQLERYIKFKQQIQKQSNESDFLNLKFQVMLAQILNLIQNQTQKQFNHIIQNQIISQSIDMSVYWALKLNNY